MSTLTTNVEEAAVLDAEAIAAAEANADATTDAAPAETVADSPEGTVDTLYYTIGKYADAPVHIDGEGRPVDQGTAERVTALYFEAQACQAEERKVLRALAKISSPQVRARLAEHIDFDALLAEDRKPIYVNELESVRATMLRSTKFRIKLPDTSDVTPAFVAKGAAKNLKEISTVVSLRDSVTLYRRGN